jgi:hypothetical protein
MVSSKKPCVNRKANKHSQLVLTPDPGEKPFADDTDVQPNVSDNHGLKFAATRANNSGSPKATGKLKLKLKADHANTATLTVRGLKRTDAIPDGTLTITLINYPTTGATPWPVQVEVDYVIEDQPP